jgi:hypothetical protein
LSAGDSYVGPTGSNDSSDLCKCNTVVYSLMSACDACQFDDAVWFPYVFLPFNLASFAFISLHVHWLRSSVVGWLYFDTDGIRGRLTALPRTPHRRSSPILICVLLEAMMIRLRFSNTIPNGTSVPAWAFIDVTVSQHRKQPSIIS